MSGDLKALVEHGTMCCGRFITVNVLLPSCSVVTVRNNGKDT